MSVCPSWQSMSMCVRSGQKLSTFTDDDNIFFFSWCSSKHGVDACFSCHARFWVNFTAYLDVRCDVLFHVATPSRHFFEWCERRSFFVFHSRWLWWSSEARLSLRWSTLRQCCWVQANNIWSTFGALPTLELSFLCILLFMPSTFTDKNSLAWPWGENTHISNCLPFPNFLVTTFPPFFLSRCEPAGGWPCKLLSTCTTGSLIRSQFAGRRWRGSRVHTVRHSVARSFDSLHDHLSVSRNCIICFSRHSREDEIWCFDIVASSTARPLYSWRCVAECLTEQRSRLSRSGLGCYDPWASRFSSSWCRTFEGVPSCSTWACPAWYLRRCGHRNGCMDPSVVIEKVYPLSVLQSWCSSNVCWPSFSMYFPLFLESQELPSAQPCGLLHARTADNGKGGLPDLPRVIWCKSRHDNAGATGLWSFLFAHRFGSSWSSSSRGLSKISLRWRAASLWGCSSSQFCAALMSPVEPFWTLSSMIRAKLIPVL